MTSSVVMLAPALSQHVVALRHGAAEVGGWSVPTDGLDPPEVLDILSALYARLEADPGWGSWFIIKDSMIVGGCSLTEPPTGDSCTIGYSVFPGSQRRGYATAAVAQMLGLLRAHGMATAQAETSTDNVGSSAVLMKCGFSRSGERFDPEDGDLIMWQRML